jgi:hypothetical protein
VQHELYRSVLVLSGCLFYPTDAAFPGVGNHSLPVLLLLLSLSISVLISGAACEYDKQAIGNHA